MKYFLLFLSMLLCSPCFCDTIKFKNGRTIHGKLTSMPSDLNKVKVSFKNKGFLIVKKSDIVNVEVNDLDDFEMYESKKENKKEGK